MVTPVLMLRKDSAVLPFSLDKLSYTELAALVSAGLYEDRGLDFKRDAIGGSDKDKREFAADVCAFANTIGGDILIGVDEVDGRATDLVGIKDGDGQKLHLENVLRGSLDPRLQRLDFAWLPASSGDRGVLVCRVPQSFVAPHRVAPTSRFHARNSAGKYDMDAAQLRAAFVSGEALVGRIRRFRTDRLDLIDAGEAALPIPFGPLAVLHIVPLDGFASRSDVTVGEYGAMLLPPSGAQPHAPSSRFTLDGHATCFFADPAKRDEASAYALLMRSGAIEAVIAIADGNVDAIPSALTAWPFLTRFKSYMAGLQRHGLLPPLYLFLSYLRVRGHRLFYDRRENVSPASYPRDRLLLPEVVLDSMDRDASQVLKPSFDILFNAFGWPNAFIFDEEGKYRGPKW